jgi:predicted membrane protein
MNWKTFGYKVTKKLVYYTLVVCAVIFLWSTASKWFSEKDTLENIAGAVLYAVTVGGIITVGFREASQLYSAVNTNETKQTETNETNS